MSESQKEDSHGERELSQDASSPIHESPIEPIGSILTLGQLTTLARRVRQNKKITVDLSSTKYEVIKSICSEKFSWNISSRSDWNIRWQDFYINEDDLRRMLPYQKINHFPGSYNLGKKNYLGKNLTKMRNKFPEEYDFFPRTWLLPYQYEDLRSFQEKNRLKKPVYIIKPEASCQGRGIYLSKKISDIRPDQHMVVQEYVKKPLLIDGLKFDFRVYVLVKSVCPLKVFIYREGLARFATQKYAKPSKKNLRNMCMHLTNYAVNKHSPEFQFNTDAAQDHLGHKRSFSSILKYLEEKGDDANKVFLEIKQIVNKTMCAVQPYLSHLYRSSQLKEENNEMCFEVFGFDVMLDEDLKPYLLEVNHTPSFTTDTPLDYQIKHSLILDTLILVDTRSKAKSTFIEQKRQFSQGKPPLKPSLETKEAIKTKISSYESRHHYGYSKSLPAEENDNLDYAKYIEAAQSNHDEFTGTRRVERVQPPQSTQPLASQTNGFMSSQTQRAAKPPQYNAAKRVRPVSGMAAIQTVHVNDTLSGIDDCEEGIDEDESTQKSTTADEILKQVGSDPHRDTAGVTTTTKQVFSNREIKVPGSAKPNTNHISKNIRRISTRIIFKASASCSSIDGLSDLHSRSATLVSSIHPLPSQQTINTTGIIPLNSSPAAVDTLHSYANNYNNNNNKNAAENPINNSGEFSANETNNTTNTTFQKLDQLKRDLQQGREEAGLKQSIRNMRSLESEQAQLFTIEPEEYGNNVMRPFSSNRPLLSSGRPTLTAPSMQGDRIPSAIMASPLSNQQNSLQQPSQYLSSRGTAASLVGNNQAAKNSNIRFKKENPPSMSVLAQQYRISSATLNTPSSILAHKNGLMTSDFLSIQRARIEPKLSGSLPHPLAATNSSLSLGGKPPYPQNMQHHQSSTHKGNYEHFENNGIHFSTNSTNRRSSGFLQGPQDGNNGNNNNLNMLGSNGIALKAQKPYITPSSSQFISTAGISLQGNETAVVYGEQKLRGNSANISRKDKQLTVFSQIESQQVHQIHNENSLHSNAQINPFNHASRKQKSLRSIQHDINQQTDSHSIQ